MENTDSILEWKKEEDKNIINKSKTRSKDSRYFTTVTLSRENLEKIKKLGNCGMTINEVITKILNHDEGFYRINVETATEQ
jgi:hypothetical protein